MRISALVLAVLSLTIPFRAALAEEETYPKLELSGNFWGAWAYDLAMANPDAPSPNGANRFEVIRTYMNFRARLSDSISLRITPDLTRVSNTDGSIDGSLVLRLKYAYVTFEDVLPGLSVRAVMQPTPYIGFSDGIWGYRVLGSDPLEFFTGVRSSDLGVGVLGAQFGEVLAYQVLVSNGEGYSRAESSSRSAAKYKDVSGRVTFSPFAAGGEELLRRLRLTVYGQYGARDKIADLDERLDRSRAMGLLTWQGPGVTLGVGGGLVWDDFLREQEDGPVTVEEVRSFLFTSWGWIDLPWRFRAVGRFDLIDPDDQESDGTGRRTRLIAGLAYRFTDDVQVIADWQRYGYQRGQNAPENALGDSLFLHLAADF